VSYAWFPEWVKLGWLENLDKALFDREGQRYPGRFSEIDRIYSAAFDTVRHGQNTAAQAMAESKPQITALLRQK
jgi:hypothetical protein